ncbi:hypothetical protein F4778DRAFT_596111 [Xylariomycetidae sp. FL2044]|nr:hypothetical protein F4778DRAFT_596111 [Xylariomycetidae sp. FL2044]
MMPMMCVRLALSRRCGSSLVYFRQGTGRSTLSSLSSAISRCNAHKFPIPTTVTGNLLDAVSPKGIVHIMRS